MGALDKGRIPPIAALALIVIAVIFGGRASDHETAHAQEAPEVHDTFDREMRRREVRALERQALQTERLVRVIERLDSRCP